MRQPEGMDMTTARHVVVGAGPVGSSTALRLAELGHDVTVLTRSGTGPSHARVTLVAGDATDVDTLIGHLDGSGALVNAANPPYHRWPQDWPPLHRAMRTAAERTGALLVLMDNLYAYGAGATMPMREDTPMRPTGPKGEVRARMAIELLEADAAGRLRAAIVRASDYYGPGVLDSAFGSRVVPRVLAGQRVSLLGALDVPHAVSFMPDVAATVVAVVTRPEAAGRTWLVPNAPAVTQREIVAAFARAAGTQPRVGAVPRAVIALGGVFIPVFRELRETWHQFAEPWTTDATRTEAALDVHATPLTEGALVTVAWWRGRIG